MEARIGTVSQINNYIKKILDNNKILNNVWVKGEISNFKRHSSGHIYLTLKDEGGVLKSVIFRSAAQLLAFSPSDGMKVMARGRVSVYEAGGAYQLYIEEMIPDGVGELYIAYEKLKKQLDAEGLFSEEFKKPIPKFPSAVGVATATTGAAVRDIINVITRRCPMTKIIIYPTQVQGAGAAQSVVRAIEYFNREKNVDTIIAGRGGGSIEDLWAFNEEITARAIFASEIPVISAVGHETDFTIADFAADLRAPTPSAAAEIAVPSSAELGNLIQNQKARISEAVLKQLEHRKLRLASLKLKSPVERIQENSQRLDHISKRMEQSFRLKTEEKKRVLGIITGKIDAMSPLKVLSRGYAIPLEEDGSVIRNASDMESGKEFTLKMTDGSCKCIVK